jgi:outer membrane autotransporter protein
VLSGQGRLRAAYSFVFQDWYVRPIADLDVIHVRTPGYSETGAGALGLTYDTASQWTAAFSPTVEVGGRMNLGNGYVLRPYGSVGASFFSNSEWTATARLQGGLGAGSFTTSIATDPVVARLSAGVQLFAQVRLDLRLTYDGAFSEHTVSNALSLRAALRF